MALHKQMMKGKFGAKGKMLETTAFQNRFNLEEDECKWPIFIHGRPVKDCNFKFKIISKNNNYDVVMIPKGTLLFHTTIKGIKNGKWWDAYFPRDTTTGGVFFNQNECHQGLHTGNIILVYKTKCDIYMLFIRNIYKNLKFSVGSDMVPHPEYRMLVDKVQSEKELKISGYMGCNECEIFIHNEDIERCIYKKPIKEQSKMID